ncbi:protein-ADP-ribose hydrolase [Candidatus Soleaferrea massiliensis]|uniref:protein-ADP-ribose hydrolase n=1 Tax=Candidatus Soleaferrea massiliensis TaxID=1470354 RepID=UPI00058FF7BE|nr:protein-ADP-ribose hydrolase [Candidatus Soleaferrea massiliensis]
MTQSQRLQWLLEYLLKENIQYRNTTIPKNEERRFRMFRSLVNIRPPIPVPQPFLEIQDAFLKEEIRRKGITDVRSIQPIRDGMCIWHGDITALRSAIIVNAANEQLLGCFSPCHSCVDNAIHTYAGVQLRRICHQLIRRQGGPEPAGKAKITSAYNLPSRFVMHTVGPIVDGTLTEQDCETLTSCYRSCLSLADKTRCKSITFCCISTGEYHFPARRAAEIAIKTVSEYQAAHPDPKRKIVFNVFKQRDEAIYRELLG